MEEIKKYKIDLEDTISENMETTTVYRIIALKTFTIADKLIKEGDKGGYIESEKNLSQEGNCWIAEGVQLYDNAKVSGDAYIEGRYDWEDIEIYENAEISGKAIIMGNGHIYGNTSITDNVRIKGELDLTENTIISGNVFITADNIEMANGVTVSGTTVCNCCTINLDGNVIIDGVVTIEGDITLKNVTINGTVSLANVEIELEPEDHQVIDFNIIYPDGDDDYQYIHINRPFKKVTAFGGFTAIKTLDDKIIINDGDEIDMELDEYIEAMSTGIRTTLEL